MQDFVHLHVHTQYSILDGQASVQKLVDKAIKDLHFVMAGGDPCKVCAKVCMMGEGNCQPVWTGEKTV